MSDNDFSDIISILSSYKYTIRKDLENIIKSDPYTNVGCKKMDYIDLYDIEKTHEIKFLSMIPKHLLEKYDKISLVYINENVVININDFTYRETSKNRLIYTLKSNHLVCLYTNEEIKNLEESDTIICNKYMQLRMFNMSNDKAYFLVFDK